MGKMLVKELQGIINRVQESESYTRYNTFMNTDKMEIEVTDLPGVYSFRYTDKENVGADFKNNIFDVKIDTEVFYKYDVSQLNLEIVSNKYIPRDGEYVSFKKLKDLSILNMDSLKQFNLRTSPLIMLDGHHSAISYLTYDDYEKCYNVLLRSNYKHDYTLGIDVRMGDNERYRVFISEMSSFLFLLERDTLNHSQNQHVFSNSKIFLSVDNTEYFHATYTYLSSVLSKEFIDIDIHLIVYVFSDVMSYNQIKSIIEAFYTEDSVFSKISIRANYACELITKEDNVWIDDDFTDYGGEM